MTHKRPLASGEYSATRSLVFIPGTQREVVASLLCQHCWPLELARERRYLVEV
jgi:hypothetical protein